jgi:YfiR/HmsC-like
VLGVGARAPAVAADYSEDVVKAAYLFRLAGYVDWPGGADRGDFVIAVLGSPAMARQLGGLAGGHLINNHPVRVREAASVRDIADPDILYVGAGRAQALRSWRPAASRSTLIVTDEEGGLRDGGMLNFLTIDRRVRFEVSLTAAGQAHLKISSELLGLAVRVFGVPRQSRGLCGPRPTAEPIANCALGVAQAWPSGKVRRAAGAAA